MDIEFDPAAVYALAGFGPQAVPCRFVEPQQLWRLVSTAGGLGVVPASSQEPQGFNGHLVVTPPDHVVVALQEAWNSEDFLNEAALSVKLLRELIVPPFAVERFPAGQVALEVTRWVLRQLNDADFAVATIDGRWQVVGEWEPYASGEFGGL